jgi:hypothetical protein
MIRALQGFFAKVTALTVLSCPLINPFGIIGARLAFNQLLICSRPLSL